VSRLLRLILLALMALTTVPAPVCALPRTSHHQSHEQRRAPDPGNHVEGHTCVGCATPLPSAADLPPAPSIAISHVEARPARLAGQVFALDPPPPRSIA